MSDSLKQPMTKEDFALIFPLLLNEIVAACTSSSSEANERQYDIANRLYESATSLAAGPDRDFLMAIASGIMATDEH